MKKLFPKGIQTFADIRKGNYYYVDKTSYIIELLKEKFVFLSRPRRFGKSLTLDTIAELFSGNKTLFKGLYAENHWNCCNSCYRTYFDNYKCHFREKSGECKKRIHSKCQ